MFHQNQNLMSPQLVAHSGFITDMDAKSIQFSSEPISFGYWFWHGGFMVFTSYLIIVLGTGVFIKYLFSILKKDQK